MKKICLLVAKLASIMPIDRLFRYWTIRYCNSMETSSNLQSWELQQVGCQQLKGNGLICGQFVPLWVQSRSLIEALPLKEQIDHRAGYFYELWQSTCKPGIRVNSIITIAIWSRSCYINPFLWIWWVPGDLICSRSQILCHNSKKVRS